MVETPASDPPLPVFINLIPPAREWKSIVDNSVQTNLENKDKAIARLNNEKKLIRFLKLWLQYSAHFGKGNEHHHKFLYFSQWRINALFDCHILERVT